MKNNYTIKFIPSGEKEIKWFYVQAKSLEDAIIAMYDEFGDNAEYLDYQVEPQHDYDNETIAQAITQRQNR